LGDAGVARRALSEAASRREELGETGAAAVTRRTLAFVVAETADEPREAPATMPFDDVWDVDRFRLHRRQAATARRGAKLNEVGPLVLPFLFGVLPGGFASVAVFDRAAPPAKRPPQQRVPKAAAPSPAPAAATPSAVPSPSPGTPLPPAAGDP